MIQYLFGALTIILEAKRYYLVLGEWEVCLSNEVHSNAAENLRAFREAYDAGSTNLFHLGKNFSLLLDENHSVHIYSRGLVEVKVQISAANLCKNLFAALEWYVQQVSGQHLSQEEMTLGTGQKIVLCRNESTLRPFDLEPGDLVQTSLSKATVLGVDVHTGHLCVSERGEVTCYPAKNAAELEALGIVTVGCACQEYTKHDEEELLRQEEEMMERALFESLKTLQSNTEEPYYCDRHLSGSMDQPWL